MPKVKWAKRHFTASYRRFEHEMRAYCDSLCDDHGWGRDYDRQLFVGTVRVMIPGVIQSFLLPDRGFLMIRSHQL